MSRRSYGSGALHARADKNGAETWYGRWYVEDVSAPGGRRRIQKKLAPKRRSGSRDGLTRTQAEAALRQKMEEAAPVPTRSDDLTVEAAAERMLGALDIKPTTHSTYRSLFETHIREPLGTVPLDQVTSEQVEALIGSLRKAEKAPKTIVNCLALLGRIFAYGKRKGWCRENPCAEVERPKVAQTADIRFLDQGELSALLAAIDTEAKPFGKTDRALLLTAAMTGLRQGELLALRWEDVDWSASKIRVRRNFVRGHEGTPKTRRGERSVPLPDTVAGELNRHFKDSAYQANEALVFPHPETGDHLDHSALSRRFKKALKAASVRPVRFHDLRHTFGTRMAAEGIPLRSLQEWMGHGDIKTTLIYADYAPSDDEAAVVEAAFSTLSRSLSQTEENSEQPASA